MQLSHRYISTNIKKTNQQFTDTQTDTEMIDFSNTHTETNTIKIFNTDTTLCSKKSNPLDIL